MGYIETADGTSLYYRDLGRGDPVVLRHPNNLSSDFWEYQTEYLLSRGLRVVAYDRRGHGRSSEPSVGYDFDTFADDLARVMNGLDLSGATLVGYSIGAGEIARYLTRHGAARVGRCVLVAPATPFVCATNDNSDGLPREFFDRTIVEMRKDRAGFFASLIDSFFGPSVSPGTVSWTLNLAMQVPLHVAVACVRAQIETDFRPDMRSFTVPTLVIQGDQDATPIALTGKKTAEAIRESEFKVYEGAHHGLLITHKDRLNDDLVRFIGARQ